MKPPKRGVSDANGGKTAEDSVRDGVQSSTQIKEDENGD